jgi:hypothetical protein
MKFYVGLHMPHHARYFERAMISVNRLRERRSPFEVGEWIMDSGAFTELATHGCYRDAPEAYAEQVNRWAGVGHMAAAVTQDYMCEPFMLAKTGLTVAAHQQLTVGRYDTLYALCRPYVMPVLQGYDPMDYVEHVYQYGTRLHADAWVGVGSVCKRNARPDAIALVLSAIKNARPDLRLHGFGLKETALRCGYIRSLLYSADSMAWSYAARREGRDANSWEEAKRWENRIVGLSA